tara:strand:+ start:248 stop:475 length:228 start_codon:yes stop_codon:yes gene_type:complete
MQSLVKKWKDHLNNNNMTYWQHLKFAVGHGVCCIKAGLFLCVHGLLPCFRRRAGERLVHRLDKDFIEHKNNVNNK